ncbi:DMT family transporter [Acuticoccus sp. MNP-M23]|uniref:DMT family transporter n=1 Tax=Acuticoccus sp. MNP-M23 TaxID=3072793 RepID=UPI00281509C0|nr:DMT family transporter [Acuticoccus sp. MNP-M23]WMS41011.1 DMT family transporter [Acuticoccus sp. MNP-M23]
MKTKPPLGPNSLIPVLAIMLGAACFGTLPLFARTLTDFAIAAPAIAFYRFALSALVLSPFLVLRGPLRGATFWGLAGGAVMGLGWIGFVVALKTLSVAETGILFMTFPLFAILFGLLFGERPGGRGWIGAALIVLAALIVAPGDALDPSGGLVAVAAALVAPAAYGLLLNIIARRVHTLPAIAATGSIAMGSVLVLAPIVATLPLGEVLPAAPAAYAWLAVFSAMTALIPQLIYVVFSPRIGAVRTAMAGSAELPTMFIVGAVAFGEPLGWTHLTAGALILCAIALTARPKASASA